MSRRKKLLLFLALWTFIGLLVHFGERGADDVLIVLWFTILIVGSVIAVFRRHRDPSSTHYIGSLLP
ncbi:MAG: hypothetical protein AB7E79_04385 [Rhodospirillaceae bacterium]